MHMMGMDMGEMMDEMMKMVPMMGKEGTVSANYYFGMTAMMGVVVWGFTAIMYQFFTPIRSNGVREVALVGAAGLVTGVWLMVYMKRMIFGKTGVKRDVQMSAPGVVWLSTMGAAFVANFAGFFMASPMKEGLMWLPWYAGFTAAYLLTGLMVRRGGIFIVAGLLSGVGLVAGLGLLPIAGVGPTRPFPLPFVIIGLLHAVPMAIDAKRGGRELTDQGVPAIKADDLGDVSVGGSDPEASD